MLKFFPENGTSIQVGSTFLPGNVALTRYRASCFVSTTTNRVYILGGQDKSNEDVQGKIHFKNLTDIENENVTWQTIDANVWFSQPIAFFSPVYIEDHDLYVGIGGIDFTDTTGAKAAFVFYPSTNTYSVASIPVPGGYTCALYNANVDRIFFVNGATRVAQNTEWSGIYASRHFITPGPTAAPSR